MKYILVINFVFVLLFSNAQSNYSSLDFKDQADLNYNKIGVIDSVSKSYQFMIDSVFNFVDGKYKIYRLVRKFQFYDKESKLVENHELLVLKVDSKKRIIDSYHYLLEFPELPSECMLYRLSNKWVGQKIKFRKSVLIKLTRVSMSSFCIEEMELYFNVILKKNCAKASKRLA